MATASAGRADKGSSRGSRAFRAPLQRARLAVGGQGRGEEKPKARQPSSCAQTQGATMSDPEIEELRDKVHCAVVLEHTLPPWMLDRKESTKLSLKYRRGKGEILIVSHGGGVRSSTTAQCTLLRRSSISGSLMVAPCV